MVSYTSVVLSFLLLVGPVLIFNAFVPDAVGQWAWACLMSAGLFVIWIATQMHDAFAQYRFVMSCEETKNIAFLGKERSAEDADAVQATVFSKPKQVAKRHPRPAATARRSPVS